MREFQRGGGRFVPIGMEDPSSGNREDRPSEPNRDDADLLDAYSRAVIRVVDQVGPAVMGVQAWDPNSSAGSGSAFLISSDGLAVTNSHVARGRSRLAAITHDGDRLPADLIGDDAATDLALLRVAARDLPQADLSDSDLRPGQLVIAMGSPLGFQSTVSTGVVSAVGRAMRTEQGRLIENVVQHTAPMNPGNSGGPLIDSHGRVVGINTAIIAMAQGMGFAIGANTATWVIGQLIAHGRVKRAHLGIVATIVTIPRSVVRELDLLSHQAVEIIQRDPNGPAAASGLAEGDLIIAVNDRIVTSVDDIHRLLSRYAAERELTLTVVRDGHQREIMISPRFA